MVDLNKWLDDVAKYYTNDARWDIVSDAMKTMEDGCRKKIGSDRDWHMIFYGSYGSGNQAGQSL